jgi:hypothetical protein
MNKDNKKTLKQENVSETGIQVNFDETNYSIGIRVNLDEMMENLKVTDLSEWKRWYNKEQEVDIFGDLDIENGKKIGEIFFKNLIEFSNVLKKYPILYILWRYSRRSFRKIGYVVMP